MRKGLFVAVSVIVAGSLCASAQSSAGTIGFGAGASTESVRPPDAKRVRTAVTGLLGWSVGIRATSFQQLTFVEAAVKADALGLAYIEGFNSQMVSPAIRKNLTSSLTPEEVAVVRAKLHGLNLKMAAYHVDSIGPDANSRRTLFEFARNLGADTIAAPVDFAALPELDRVANEFGINLAVESKDGDALMAALAARSKRIGAAADVGYWMSKNIQPLLGIATLQDRSMVVNLPEKMSADTLSAFLLGMAKLEPDPRESPNACTNCSRPYSGIRPVFLAVEPAAVETFEKAARPAMGYRVGKIASEMATTSPSKVPDAERQKIEAALPRQAPGKIRKARKLLVIDLCPAGAYYHASIAHTNLALQLMAEKTRAYEPVFSNDLSNLKYDKIRKFDAVFLNNTEGEIFSDPEVLGGLIRYVKEGGGLAGIHAASYASLDIPEVGDLLGAADGPHKVETATLKIEDPKSPLNYGFTTATIEREDEFYHFLPDGPYSRDKLHVLISIDTNKSDLSQWKVRPDKDYGLSWIRSYGRGRVFHCALGHTPTLFATPALAAHVLAGIQFVLGDLDADTTPSSKMKKKQSAPEE